MILVEKKRVFLNLSVDEWLVQAMAMGPFKEAPLTAEVALATSKVHLSHRDPADAFLVATAKVLDLTFATADSRVLTAKGVSFLPNR